MQMTKTALACGLCLGLFACASTPHPATVATVDGDAHVTVRAEGGRLWWSHRPWGEPHALWSLPNHGAVEHLSVSVASAGEAPVFVVGFDQGGVRYSGRFGLDATSAMTPAGDAPTAFTREGAAHDVASSSLDDALARSGR
jgi:hypothetical protein